MTRADILKAIKQNESAVERLDRKVKRSRDPVEKETMVLEVKRLEYRILQYKDQLKKLDMN